MRHSFTPGTLWILSKNASCIPAGCYRLQGVEGELLIFSVSSDISFGLTKEFYAPLLRKADSRNAVRTSTASFLRRYAKRMRSTVAASASLSAMTFCAMSPHIKKKVMEGISSDFFPTKTSIH